MAIVDPISEWGVIADAGHEAGAVAAFIATYGGESGYWDELLASARAPQP